MGALRTGHGVAAVGCLLLAAGAWPAGAETNLTVHANVRRSVGGVNVLERERYFNHWGTFTTGLGANEEELLSPDGLNSFTARETFEFDFFSSSVPEDPARPGFFDRDELASAFQSGYNNYRSWVLSEPRWRSLREHPNPVFVQSGRAAGAWRDFILREDGSPTLTTLPIAAGGAAYAELLNVYLEEVVYGTGPGQGYLPFDNSRFHLEIINEPHLELRSGVTWDDVIQFHRTVTEQVKAAFPQASLGGASAADALALSHPWSRMRQLIDDMAGWDAQFDFWTVHPYEGYIVNSSGTPIKITPHSPGHLNALLDLYETHSNNVLGEPKQFAVTEYGTFIFNQGLPQNEFGDFPLAERQWVSARDTIDKLMVFLDRPDRIITATPFIAPQFFDTAFPTPANGAYNNIFIRDENGAFVETILGGLYRMYNDVRGEYVALENDNLDLQSVAFRDGDQLYVLLNNLQTSSNAINLEAIAGLGSVTSASLDRLFWDASLGEGVYQSGLDVSGSWRDLTLLPEEGAVLTLTLDAPLAYDFALDERTFYGDRIETPIGANGLTEAIGIPNADTTDAVSASIRVAYTRPGSRPAGEGFAIIVNGERIEVPSTGVIGFDDNDRDLITRVVEVPLDVLNDGDNSVVVDFLGRGGTVVSTTLLVTRSLGDFNGNGEFDGEDLSLLFAAFGDATDPRFDLVEDGVVDLLDVEFWSEELRGAPRPSGDFSGDGVVSAADYTVIRDLDAGEFPFNREFWARRFGQSGGAGATAAVPEPGAALLLLLAAAGAASARALKTE